MSKNPKKPPAQPAPKEKGGEKPASPPAPYPTPEDLLTLREATTSLEEALKRLSGDLSADDRKKLLSDARSAERDLEAHAVLMKKEEGETRVERATNEEFATIISRTRSLLDAITDPEGGAGALKEEDVKKRAELTKCLIHYRSNSNITDPDTLKKLHVFLGSTDTVSGEDRDKRRDELKGAIGALRPKQRGELIQALRNLAKKTLSEVKEENVRLPDAVLTLARLEECRTLFTTKPEGAAQVLDLERDGALEGLERNLRELQQAIEELKDERTCDAYSKRRELQAGLSKDARERLSQDLNDVSSRSSDLDALLEMTIAERDALATDVTTLGTSIEELRRRHAALRADDRQPRSLEPVVPPTDFRQLDFAGTVDAMLQEAHDAEEQIAERLEKWKPLSDRLNELNARIRQIEEQQEKDVGQLQKHRDLRDDAESSVYEKFLTSESFDKAQASREVRLRVSMGLLRSINEKIRYFESFSGSQTVGSAAEIDRFKEQKGRQETLVASLVNEIETALTEEAERAADIGKAFEGAASGSLHTAGEAAMHGAHQAAGGISEPLESLSALRASIMTQLAETKRVRRDLRNARTAQTALQRDVQYVEASPQSPLVLAEARLAANAVAVAKPLNVTVVNVEEKFRRVAEMMALERYEAQFVGATFFRRMQLKIGRLGYLATYRDQCLAELQNHRHAITEHLNQRTPEPERIDPTTLDRNHPELQAILQRFDQAGRVGDDRLEFDKRSALSDQELRPGEQLDTVKTPETVAALTRLFRDFANPRYNITVAPLGTPMRDDQFNARLYGPDEDGGIIRKIRLEFPEIMGSDAETRTADNLLEHAKKLRIRAIHAGGVAALEAGNFKVVLTVGRATDVHAHSMRREKEKAVEGRARKMLAWMRGIPYVGTSLVSPTTAAIAAYCVANALTNNTIMKAAKYATFGIPAMLLAPTAVAGFAAMGIGAAVGAARATQLRRQEVRDQRRVVEARDALRIPVHPWDRPGSADRLRLRMTRRDAAMTAADAELQRRLDSITNERPAANWTQQQRHDAAALIAEVQELQAYGLRQHQSLQRNGVAAPLPVIPAATAARAHQMRQVLLNIGFDVDAEIGRSALEVRERLEWEEHGSEAVGLERHMRQKQYLRQKLSMVAVRNRLASYVERERNNPMPQWTHMEQEEIVLLIAEYEARRNFSDASGIDLLRAGNEWRVERDRAAVAFLIAQCKEGLRRLGMDVQTELERLRKDETDRISRVVKESDRRFNGGVWHDLGWKFGRRFWRDWHMDLGSPMFSESAKTFAIAGGGAAIAGSAWFAASSPLLASAFAAPVPFNRYRSGLNVRADSAERPNWMRVNALPTLPPLPQAPVPRVAAQATQGDAPEGAAPTAADAPDAPDGVGAPPDASANSVADQPAASPDALRGQHLRAARLERLAAHPQQTPATKSQPRGMETNAETNAAGNGTAQGQNRRGNGNRKTNEKADKDREALEKQNAIPVPQAPDEDHIAERVWNKIQDQLNEQGIDDPTYGG